MQRNSGKDSSGVNGRGSPLTDRLCTGERDCPVTTVPGVRINRSGVMAEFVSQSQPSTSSPLKTSLIQIPQTVAPSTSPFQPVPRGPASPPQCVRTTADTFTYKQYVESVPMYLHTTPGVSTRQIIIPATHQRSTACSPVKSVHMEESLGKTSTSFTPHSQLTPQIPTPTNNSQCSLLKIMDCGDCFTDSTVKSPRPPAEVIIKEYTPPVYQKSYLTNDSSMLTHYSTNGNHKVTTPVECLTGGKEHTHSEGKEEYSTDSTHKLYIMGDSRSDHSSTSKLKFSETAVQQSLNAGQPPSVGNEKLCSQPRVVVLRRGDKILETLPAENLHNKSERERMYLIKLNNVDHQSALEMSRFDHLPLPLLERLECDDMPGKRQRAIDEHRDPLCDIHLPNWVCRGSSISLMTTRCRVDGNAFIMKCKQALSNCCDDVKALIDPTNCCPSPSTNCCGRANGHIKCTTCGANANYCPECGNSHGDFPITRVYDREGHFMPSPPVDSPRSCMETYDRIQNFSCNFFGDVGDTMDRDLLSQCLGNYCALVGKCTDDTIIDFMKKLTKGLASFCPGALGIPKNEHEGYAMYEPDPTLCRKERPTSATGNYCLDNVNVILDQCLLDPRDPIADRHPPPIPATQSTGIWLVDQFNNVLDKCCQEPAPLPPPSRMPKNKCPQIDWSTISTCLEPKPPTPPATPPPETCCPLLALCEFPKPKCPTCHQKVNRSIKFVGRREVNNDKCVIKVCNDNQPDEPSQVYSKNYADMVFPYSEVYVPKEKIVCSTSELKYPSGTPANNYFLPMPRFVDNVNAIPPVEEFMAPHPGVGSRRTVYTAVGNNTAISGAGVRDCDKQMAPVQYREVAV